jgi:hypothetical protein
LLGGCNEPTLIRSIFEYHSWIKKSNVDPKMVLNDTLGVIEHAILKNPGATFQCPETLYKLPMHLPSKVKSCVYSKGPSNLPAGVEPFSEGTEKLIIITLLQSLNEKLKLKLDCDPATTRSDANSINECTDFVIIGGDHSVQTCEALKARGKKVQLVYLPNYRTSTVHAGKLREALETVTITPSTILILQVFDSGFFMVLTEEGGLIPPCKRADGSVHIDGNLHMISKDMQFSLFKQVMDELQDWKTNYIIILAPLPRYMEMGCCTDQDHVANRKQPEFKKNLEEAVFNSRTNLKNFAFRSGIRKCVTISTWGKVRKLPNLWVDQINMVEDAHKLVSAAIEEAAGELVRKRPAEAEHSTQAKRPKTVSSDSQQKSPGTNSVRGRGRGPPGVVEDHHRGQHDPGWIKRGGRGGRRPRGHLPRGYGGSRGRH